MNEVCKICQCATIEIYHPILKGNYYYCKNCEFISKDEDNLISEAQELKIYNFHNNSLENLGYVTFLKEFVNHSVLPFANGKKVLDFGSGPTPVLAHILKEDYDFEVEIYDLFFSPLKVYETQKYDVITSTEVIEHLQNPLIYFALFKSLLAKDGILSIMTLFHPNDEDKFIDWYYIRDHSHISFYTTKTIEFIAKKNGLKMIYTNNHRYITLQNK
ncbi:MAG: class I SAM-dependent methyltransferase [Firmicutes bacterium]|nr:class I SAM-dependent methyltransferase [Bacillota bacterium]